MQLKEHITQSNLFKLVVLISCLPVVMGHFFPTLDGAAHVYNANIIKHLIGSQESIFHTMFSLNPEPIPNWLGHAILVLFNTIVPAFISEKILLLIYIIALPLVFRNLIKSIAPKQLWLSFGVFPFVYSFVFLLGFYNFCLALVLLFFTLNFWIIREGRVFTKLEVLGLFSLLVLVYFAHIFIFGLLLMFIGIRFLSHLFFARVSTGNKSKKWLLLKATHTALAAIFPFVLLVMYFYNRRGLGVPVYLDLSTLFSELHNIRSILAYNIGKEQTFSFIIFYLLFSLAAIGLFKYVEDRNKFAGFKDVFTIKFSKKALPNYWFVIWLVLFVLYFFLPDSDGLAGFVSVRVSLLVFFFLLLLLATISWPLWLQRFSIAVFVFAHGMLLIYYSRVSRSLDKNAQELAMAAESMADNSVVLSINRSQNWLQGNFSNYLGVEKALLVLDNYEAGTGYFPVKWKNETEIPRLHLSEKSPLDFDCVNWVSGASGRSLAIDYVVRFGSAFSDSSCDQELLALLKDEAEPVYESDYCTVYKMIK